MLATLRACLLGLASALAFSFCAAALAAEAAESHGVRGAEDAPVTLMVFSDFSCPYCAKAAPVVEQLEGLYPGKIAFVFKHFPLRRSESAYLPHEAAAAAAKQGRFWQMHDLLFAEPQKHDIASLKENARRLKLNLAEFSAALAEHRFRAAISRDIIEAQALRVTATPTFFIDGYKLEGLQSLSTFQQIIDNRLERRASR